MLSWTCWNQGIWSDIFNKDVEVESEDVLRLQCIRILDPSLRRFTSCHILDLEIVCPGYSQDSESVVWYC